MLRMADRGVLGTRVRLAACFGVAVSFGCAFESVDSEPEIADIGETSKPITNASGTSQIPSAVSLFIYDSGLCSATILSPHWILTAAHCLEGVPNGATIDIADGNGGTIYSGTANFHTHPHYGGTSVWGTSDTDDDVGLVQIPGDGLVPPDTAAFYTDHLDKGDVVAVIGFGYGSPVGSSSDCDDGFYGPKRIAFYPLTTVETEKLEIDYGNQEICPGDSGGPWHEWLAGRHMVVGLSANRRWYNDADAVRVRPKIDWFEEASAAVREPLTCPTYVHEGYQYRECFEHPLRARGVDAGHGHACAALEDGRARCWGQGTSGQLGNGETQTSALPVTVDYPAASKVLEVAAGLSHSCARLANNTVQCWGSNSHGQLGNSVASSIGDVQTTPIAVTDKYGLELTNVRQITAGETHTCALIWTSIDPDTGPVDAKAVCWGANKYGQLGDGSRTTSAVPRVVGTWEELQIALADTGSTSAMQKRTSGAKRSTASGFREKRSRPAAGRFVPLADIVSIDAGRSHTCARLGDGKAVCWGRNNVGQVGDGSHVDRLSPVTVPGLSKVRSISAGRFHTCAVAGNAGYCWGDNNFGQLANGGVISSDSPVNIGEPLAAWSEVTAGAYHSCFFSGQTGMQSCAGNNKTGGLGSTGIASYEPSLVDTAISNVRKAAGGTDFTCSLLYDGAVACTGWNAYGQLGQDHFDNTRWPSFVRDLNAPE